jgi:adenylate cyclase
VFYGFFFESAKRGELKEMFGQYVPAAHVDKMLESSQSYTFDGESREMSVLFADIRGFTSLSEKLSPVQLKKFLNDFFTPMTKVIFDNNGTIDKYVGDMIMAFWGAPLENKHHSRDAIRSGMMMLVEAQKLSHHFESMGILDIHIGVGINTGFMNVGDMGSVYRRSYTVLGDAVNLASRLESATKFYGASMIISASTLQGNEDEIVALHLDKVKVKGREDAVDIYEPLCTKAAATEIILKEVEYNKIAQSYYYAADWPKALAAYQSLQKSFPNRKLYTLYLDRVITLAKEGVRPGWDGCYVKTEK